MRLHFLIILFALTAVCAPAYAQDNSLVREFFYKSDYAGCIREGQKLLATAPWNIKDEIMEQMSCIRDWGGRFVTFIPKVKVN